MPATSDDTSVSLDALRLIEMRDELREMDERTDLPFVGMHLRATAHLLEGVAVLKQASHEMVEDAGKSPAEANRECWQEWFSHKNAEDRTKITSAERLREQMEIAVQDTIEENTGEREDPILPPDEREVVEEEVEQLETALEELAE